MKMGYRCLAEDCYADADGYAVVALREQDIMQIKEWRNAQIDVLRQNRPLSDEEQRRYYRQVVEPSFAAAEPQLILFSFLHHGELIGYGGLTNLDWVSRRAEVSFLVDPVRAGDHALYEQVFLAFLSLMRRVAFAELNLNRLFIETFDIRPHHVSAIERFGFRPEGRLKQHVWTRGRFVDSLIHGYLKEYWTGGEEPAP